MQREITPLPSVRRLITPISMRAKVLPALISKEPHPLIQPSNLPHLAPLRRSITNDPGHILQPQDLPHFGHAFDALPHLGHDRGRVPDDSSTITFVRHQGLSPAADVDQGTLPGVFDDTLCGCFWWISAAWSSVEHSVGLSTLSSMMAYRPWYSGSGVRVKSMREVVMSGTGVARKSSGRKVYCEGSIVATPASSCYAMCCLRKNLRSEKEGEHGPFLYFILPPCMCASLLPKSSVHATHVRKSR